MAKIEVEDLTKNDSDVTYLMSTILHFLMSTAIALGYSGKDTYVALVHATEYLLKTATLSGALEEKQAEEIRKRGELLADNMIEAAQKSGLFDKIISEIKNINRGE